MAKLSVFVGFLVLGVGIAAPAAAAPPAYKLREVQPGAGSSYPTDFIGFQGVTDPGPRAYFFAAYASPGPGLWKTDGTDAGTVLVSTSQTISNVYEMAVVGGKLFFSSTGLWVSDGTDAGTVAIPGSGRIPERFFDAGGGRLVFASDPDGSGWDLYVSDGVTATAYPAYDNPSHFTAFGGRVLFRTYDDRLVLFDAATGAGIVVDTQVGSFAVHGGLIYYNKNGELWRSDGSPGPGMKVSSQGGGSYTSLGPDLLFVSGTTALGAALYKWDGSAISLVADPVPGNDYANLAGLEGPEQLIVRLGKLFFVADDGVHGKEIWSSDGTPAGTAMVKDIRPGIASSGPYGMLLDDIFCEGPSHCTVEWGGVFYFSADDGIHGEALWKTDGTEAGTVLVQDFSTRNTYSAVSHLAVAGGRLYLGAADGFPNVEPWVLPLTPTVFAQAVRSAEGTGGTPTATVTVSLEPPAAFPVSVNWSTADDTALAGSDYATASGTLTFPPGGPPQTILVPVVGDSVVEPDERLFVDLASAAVTVGTPRVAVTLRNDDGPVMSVSDVVVPEVAASRAFTVTLSAPSAQDVSVNWAIEGETADPSVNGPDYSATPTLGTLTFTPGQVSKTIPFTVIADTRDEEDETIFLRLTNAVGADMPIDYVRGTIVDDDGPPPITISANASAAEGGLTSHNSVTFSVPLNGQTDKPVRVCYDTSDGTATAGVDYVALSGCLDLDNDSVTASVPVPIIGDVTDEAAETLFLTLRDPVNATITTAQRQGTIVNDDAAQLAVGNVTVTEGATGTTVPANIAVTLNHPSSWTVSVDYATAPGTTNPATDGVDYTGVSGTLTFPPGTTSLSVPVTVIGDDVDEGTSETFFLNLTNAMNAALPANTHSTVTITDDDLARFSVADVSLVEGNSGKVTATLTVTLGAAYKGASSVKYYTANGTAVATGATPDFVGISNGSATGAVLLSFPAGTLSQDVTVEVYGDTIKEVNNEYFYLNLTAPSGGPTVLDPQAKITILDDDGVAADRRLSIAPKLVSVTEPSSGETPTVFTVSLIPASGTTPTPSGLPVTVSIVAGGTASAPADYTGVPATLTFAPGTATQTVTAAVQSDAILENPESALLTLANPTNATIAASSTTTSGSGTLTIYDAVSRDPLGFYTVDPCRAVDTRDAGKGGPAPVAAGTARTFVIAGVCGVPATARAVSVNVTVANATVTGNVRVYPAGTGLPSTSNLNYLAGQTRANNAIVLLGSQGDVTVVVSSGTTHVVVDVNGYME
jgi:ELWxxDGT repeat protein